MTDTARHIIYKGWKSMRQKKGRCLKPDIFHDTKS